MKKNFITILFCSIYILARSQDPAYPPAPPLPQNIVAAEYYIDIDPGFGNGQTITITPGVDLNSVPVSVNTTGLSNGIHRVFIRTKNNEGAWSISNFREFLYDQDPGYTAAPAAPQNITAAEYFIDTDPGFGNGNSITITAGVDLNNVPASVNTTGLSTGIHRVYIHTRNNEGRWSITNARDFLVDFDPAYSTAPAAPQNIVTAEYFIDTDPGFGNGTPITITPAVDINNLIASANTTGLTTGTHRFYLRTKNNEGSWGITSAKEFIVDLDFAYPPSPAAPQNIIAAEYFIDTDPGTGNGIAVSLTAAVDISNVAINPSLVGLSNGIHRIYLRTKSNEGHWGITNVKDFLYDADPLYATVPSAPGNITYAEYFFDTDPGFGNGQLIAITPGVDLSNVAFTADVTALGNGNHQLFIRSLDDWSITNYQTFLKGSPVPLRLLSFAAAGNKNDVLITWNTDNEINTSHFDIEFSADGITFIKAGDVTARNGGNFNQYSFTHTSPAGIVLYYRLKQIDLDGKFVYSNVVKVNMQKKTQPVIYPNPAADFILVKNIKPNEVQQLLIISSDGKTVINLNVNITMQFDVSRLKAGMYLLKINKKDNQTSAIPFVKQ